MGFPIKIIKQNPKLTWERVFIPPWLANRDLPAPCFCGQPEDDEPMVVGETHDGLTRWFHYSCWRAIGMEDPTDWYDEYDDDDE